jgi:hypothetical protein
MTMVALLVGILISLNVLSTGIISYGTVFGSLTIVAGLVLFFEEVFPALRKSKSLTSISSIVILIVAVAAVVFGILALFGSVAFIERLRWTSVIFHSILLVLVGRSLFN